MRKIYPTLVVFCVLIFTNINLFGQDSEPNNDYSTANQIAVNSYSYGDIDYMNDMVDWFKVTITEPGQINLNINVVSTDVALNFIGQNGVTVLQQSNVNGSGGSESLSVQGLIPGTYYIRIDGVTGVGSYAMQCEFVSSLLNTTIYASPSVGDAPLSVNFSVSSNGQIILYQWDFDNDDITDDVTSYPYYTFTTPGVYNVRVIVQSSTAAIDTAYQTITVNTPPVYNFVFDDFEIANYKTKTNSNWMAINDNPSGGASTIATSYIAGPSSSGAIQANYSLVQSTLSYNPYVLVTAPLTMKNNTLNLTNSTGISFYYKGDAASLQIQTSDITDFAYYQVSIPTTADWTLYTFLWTDFVQLAWGTQVPLDLNYAQAVAFQVSDVDGTTGSFAFDDVTITGYHYIPVQEIVLYTNTINLQKLSSSYINYYTNPSNASIQTVTYVSLDTSIVSIDTYGSFFCKKEGNANILVVSDADTTITATASLTVTPIPVNAEFSSNTTMGYVPMEVNFYSNSTGESLTYEWDFNNDGIVDDNTEYPIYTFTTAGNYTVKLKIKDIKNEYDSIVKVDFIKVANSGELIPDFTASSTTGNAPFTSYFYDNSFGSGITSWEWDFNNDGIVDDTLQNPVYTYNQPGTFNVKLTIKDGDLIPYTIVKNNYVTVSPQPIQANFITDIYSGYAPLTVHFNDNSYGGVITAWEWDFYNDGIVDDTIPNPVYTFTTQGYIPVKLTVYDAYGQVSSYVNDYAVSVSLPNPPYAYFNTSTSSGYAPLSVQFTDMSSGTNLTYEWDFNNDTIIESTEQNPNYIFTAAGEYNIRLTVTDAFGQKSNYNSYISVQEDTRLKYCDIKSNAVLGSNFADFASSSTNENGRFVKWYSYTSSSFTRVKIDICGAAYSGWAEVYEIFSDCNYSYLYGNIKNLPCSNGKMSSIVTVNAGQTIYFSIVSDGPINGATGIEFVISEVPIVQGDICTMPLTAQLGSNTANTTNGDSWFRYIAQQDGYLEVSSCGTTTNNTSLEIYRSNCNYLFTSADDNCGLQAKSFFHVAMGDTIIISWKDYYYKGQFNWNLTQYGFNDLYVDFDAYPRMGVDSALINFNSTGINAETLNWDFTNDGITDATGPNVTWAFMDPGFYNVTLKAIHTDGIQTATITKQKYILVQNSTVGNTCENAQPAVIGNNSMSFINGQTQWFTIPIDYNGKLKIDLCNSTYPSYANVYSISNSCNGTSIYSNQNIYCGNKNSMIVDVTAGTNIMFQISTNGYVEGFENLQFELIKILPEPGDLCSLPLPILNNGIYVINKAPYSQGQFRSVFYEFTAPRDGVMELNSCVNQDGGYVNFSVFKDCNYSEGSYYEHDYKNCSSSTQGYINSVKLNSGDHVIIGVNAEIYNSAQWQFTFRDYYNGEVCSKPLLAKVGINTVPSSLEEVYYTYTPTSTGLVTVSNCQYFANITSGITEEGGSGVMVQTSCDQSGAILTYAMANCGKGAETAFEVVAGQTYLIKWFTLPGSSWTLELIPNATLPQGYSCNNPYVLTSNETTVNPTGNIAWFEFTMPQSGTYALSSDLRNEAALFIMEQCMPITENMTSSVPYVMTDSALVFWPEVGKTYKMLLVFKEEAPQIPYTIYSRYISSQSMPANIICNDAQLITATGPQVTTTKYGTYWYQYNAKANTILHLDVDYNMLSEIGANVSMYYNCPTPFNDGYDGYYNDYYPYCGSSLQGMSRRIYSDTTIYIQVRTNDTTATVNWGLFEYNTSAAGILSFSLYNQITPAVIDNVNNTIHVTLSQSADTNYISPNFQMYIGSQMFDQNNNPICPNSQLYVQNGQVQVKVKSLDGTVTENWIISVEKSSTLNTAANIEMLSSNVIKNVAINPTTKTINANLSWFATNCFDLYPQLSAGANSTGFSSTICYTSQDTTYSVLVIAEDGITSATWQINLHRESKPVGVMCANPKIAQTGYNNLSYDNTQSTVWLRYVVKNDGLLNIEACNSYNPIVLTVMSDCSALLPANYSSCNGYSNSKAELNVVKNQVIYIKALRSDSTYYSNTDMYITEVPNMVTYFSVSPTDISVFLNDTVNLNMIIYPSNALMQNISASISTGALTPIAINRYKATQVGDAVITFTTTDGSNKTQTVTVHVKPLPILVNNIIIPTSYSVIPEQTITIPAIITPLNVDNKGLSWTSSNPNVAFVDQFGVLYARSVGTTVINAYSLDGSNKISNNCTITVNPVAAQSIIVNKSSIQIPVGGIYSDLVATVLPINATDKDLVWTSNNPVVVSIVDNQLYGFSTGTTTIKIALASNPTIFVNVNVAVTSSVILDKTILVNNILQAQNTLNTISSQGLIGINTGQYPAADVAVFEIAVNDAQTVANSATTQSQIDQAIVDLQLAKTQLEQSRIGQIQIAYLNIKRDTIYAFVNETKQVTPEILPSNATYINLNWTTNNSTIATVNSNGLISAIGVGQTYIKAETKDGSNKADSVLVLVSSQLMGIYLTQSASVIQGSTIKLEPVTYPMNAPIEGFTWISDDESVATVDAYGNVTGVNDGIAIISVIENRSGKTASCVVYVELQPVSVTGIQIIRDTIQLVLGKTDVIYPYVLPYNATNQQYTWAVNNSNIIINSSGLITAFNIGSSIVTVTSTDGGYVDSVVVNVVPSEPPVVTDVETVLIESGTSQVELDLSNYITDDNTSIEDIQIEVVNNPNYTITVVNNTLVIEPISPSVPVVDTIEVKITDQDNLETVVFVPIEVSIIPNESPEFVVESPEFKALDGTSFSGIDLTGLVDDDYTANSDLQFEITTPSTNFITFINNGVLEVSRIDANWVGIDSITVTVTDGAGLTTSQKIILEVSQLPNDAPVLSSIPTQNYIQSTSKYPLLDLKRYVSDDYTLPSDMSWSFVPNPKLQITITRGVAIVYPADRNWNGSTSVTYYAYDEDGLSASITVEYVQTVGFSASWLALPKIAFTASQTVVGAGTPITFTSSITGADSWIWEFEGLQLPPQQRIVPNPTVTYTKGGKYTVKLYAGNSHGDDSLVKVDYITVIGIDEVPSVVCKGSSLTLSSTVPASAGYTFQWNTGATTESITETINTVGTVTYNLTVKKGWFTYEDEVTITVPDTLVLPDDVDFCSGDSYTVSVPGYSQYNWDNAGWTATNNKVLTQVGNTILRVRDANGCESEDSIAVTAVHSLPQVDLGADQDVCEGSSTTVTPTITGGLSPYAKLWSTTATTNTITVNTDGNYSIQVTDANGCNAVDTVAVTILHPYAEQIGVATFAKEGNGVVIAWERSLGKRTASYEVERQTDVAGVYETIATVPFNVTQSFVEDNDANVLTKSYIYRLITIDSTCNNRAISEPHHTVHVLTNYNSITNKVNLLWSKYEAINIPTYKIMKGTSLSNLVQVDAVAGNASPSWNDPEEYVPGDIYRIEMVLPDTVETRWALWKIESGPFTLALSNIAEVETNISTVENNVAVYPTIATDFVTVEFENSVDNASLQVISSSGEVVYVQSSITGNKTLIPVDRLAQGVYTVIVNSGKKQITSSIIVQ